MIHATPAAAKEFDKLPSDEVRQRFLRRFEGLCQRQPNILNQIIPVQDATTYDPVYRMKVARQWVALLKWENEGQILLTGLKHRSDPGCYKIS